MRGGANSFLAVAAAYGAARHLGQAWDARVWTYDYALGMASSRPVLVTEMAGLALVGGAAAAVMWPVYLASDVTALELRLRGLPGRPALGTTADPLRSVWDLLFRL